MLDVCGLITARGGSKGIPRKNLRELAGKPLIAWTIEAAQRARTLDRVLVSTDDPEIAETGREWGAQVPFLRPQSLAQDDSAHIDVVRHAADWLSRHEDRCPEYIMVLPPTAPLRSAQDIDDAVELAEAKRADVVVSVVKAQHHPYLTRKLDETGHLREFVPCDLEYQRRQDLPPAYALNGAIYLIRTDVLNGHTSLAPHGAVALVMPPHRSLDIDSPWDFHLAELVINNCRSPEPVGA